MSERELYLAVHDLRDKVQAMREDGEQDLRTVLHHIDKIMGDFESPMASPLLLPNDTVEVDTIMLARLLAATYLYINSFEDDALTLTEKSAVQDVELAYATIRKLVA